MWVLLTISAALLVTHDARLRNSIYPELARFELPFVWIVSTWINILASSLYSEDGVELYPALSLEEM